MDRIKNLSLDQKAKLYYMALLKKGMIDTLPEDPKAAYVQSMMDEPASSKFSEPMGKEEGWAGQMTAHTNEEPTIDPEDEEQEEWDKGWYGESLKEAASKLGYLKEDFANQKYYDLLSDLRDEGHLHRYGVTQLQMQFGLSEEEAQEIYNQYKEDLEAEQPDAADFYLKDLNEESNQYQKVTFIYTEQGGHFYGLDVYASKDQPQRSAKMRYDEANEWLKGVLEYIHEGDLIPRRYNSGLEDLDLIVARLEELGIEASHGDYMDVS